MFYSQDFELDIISHCLKNPLYLKQHQDKFKNIKFQDKFVNIVYKNILKCVSEYNIVPTDSELKRMVSESMAENEKFNILEIEATVDLITKVYERNTTDLTGISVSHYLAEQEAKKIAEELSSFKGVELLKNSILLENRLAKLRRLVNNNQDLGLNLFSDEGLEIAKKQLEDYNSIYCLPTGYKNLDFMLNGGFRKGELEVILCPTNGGKTMMLLNLAANYLKQGNRVVYLVLDNVEGEMISRSIGCLANVDITQKMDSQQAVDYMSYKHLEKHKNNWWYKHYAPRELNKSVLESYLDDLKLHLYQLDKETNDRPEHLWGQIDVLIIDYLELMIPEDGAGEQFWIAAEYLSQELKGVLKRYNILGLTATQGGTEAMKADTVKLHMAAGAKSRFNAPDNIFSISQTDNEKKEGKFRFSCLKARRPKTNYQIFFRAYTERQYVEECDETAVFGLDTPSDESGKEAKAESTSAKDCDVGNTFSPETNSTLRDLEKVLNP